MKGKSWKGSVVASTINIPAGQVGARSHAKRVAVSSARDGITPAFRAQEGMVKAA